MRHSRNILITAVATVILLLFFYHNYFLNIDKHGPGSCGDGAKNYYTLAYYLKYDSGLHFSGMNYPYGEHIIFTDNQPAVALLLKPLNFIFPDISNHIHALYGWLAFFSIVISAIFIYLCLIELGVNQFHAVLFSFLIACLTPQFIRLAGHYSLSYTFYIPVLNYYLIKTIRGKNSFRFTCLIAIFIIAFSFVHLYNLAFALFYFAAVSLLLVVFGVDDFKNKLGKSVHIFFAALIPLIVVKTILALTDKITDRPQAPWGYFESLTEWKNILFHPYSFSGELFGKIPDTGGLNYLNEGAAYIGAVPGIVIFISAFYIVGILFSKRKLLTPQAVPIGCMLAASGLLLFFAMGIPFVLKPCRAYYDYLPVVLKQFRAVGRFNWVFYYSVTLFTVVLLDHFIKKLSRINFLTAVVFSLGIWTIWFCDLNMISLRVMNDLSLFSSDYDEEKDKAGIENEFSKCGISAKNFQAIFPVPFFLAGSDRIGETSVMMPVALRVSLFEGLPVVCGEMSRTSESQTFKINNLLSEPYLKKNILKIYKDNKPLLLVTPDSYKFKPEEQRLINQAKFLFEFNNGKYYSLPLTAFKDIADSISHQLPKYKTDFYPYRNFLATDSNAAIVYVSFDSLQQNNFAFTSGTMETTDTSHCLYNQVIPNSKSGTAYEISVWTYANPKRPSFPVLFLQEKNKDGNTVFEAQLNPFLSHNSFGKWVRCAYEFSLGNSNDRIVLSDWGEYGIYDELLIRPLNCNVVSQINNDSLFLYNNYPILKTK